MKKSPRDNEGFTLSRHVDQSRLFDGATIAYDLLMRLLFSAGGVEGAGKRATIVDLRTLANGLTRDQLMNVAAVQLGVSVEELNEKHKDAQVRSAAERHYKRINNALEVSRQFIVSELKLPLPNKVASTKVHSSSDLVNLLSKVTLFREGEKGLDTHLAYCALIKCAIAALELETHAAGELQKEALWLQSVITKPEAVNDFLPLVIAKPFGVGLEEIDGMLSVTPPCDVKFSMRQKSWQSIMRKYLVKPESNAKEAFKDAIALRFKLDGSRAGTAKRVLEYLHKHAGAEFTLVANKGVVSNAEFSTLFHSLRRHKGAAQLAIDPASNPKSAKGYAVLQFNGVLKVPEGGDVSGTRNAWRKRAFEIQFVDTQRKPNLGLASDAVYALKKDIIIATRLFGSVKKDWITERAMRIASDPDVNMSHIEILNALEREGDIFRKPNSHDSYAASAVWKRWLEVPGLINDEKIRAPILHAMAR